MSEKMYKAKGIFENTKKMGIVNKLENLQNTINAYTSLARHELYDEYNKGWLDALTEVERTMLMKPKRKRKKHEEFMEDCICECMGKLRSNILSGENQE